jgi:hypothetical protein
MHAASVPIAKYVSCYGKPGDDRDLKDTSLAKLA